MERTLFDRFVNSAYRGRRVIGKPMRYNMRTQQKQGWVELVFNPRTRAEQYVSNAYRFCQPYLAAFTYKFHAEKAREAGKSHTSKQRLALSPAASASSAAPKVTRKGVHPGPLGCSARARPLPVPTFL